MFETQAVVQDSIDNIYGDKHIFFEISVFPFEVVILFEITVEIARGTTKRRNWFIHALKIEKLEFACHFYINSIHEGCNHVEFSDIN